MFRKGLTVFQFIIFAVIAALLVAVLLASMVWKIWRDHKYEPFTEGMKYARSSTGFVPRYTAELDGDIYYVKYPDFLQTTGNLAVKPEQDSALDSLLIWPQPGGGFKYSMILKDGSTSYQVYINQTGDTALFEDYQWLVEEHKAVIGQYLAKANAMWDLS
ncbi:MAG: hypothetical protein IJ960_04650 [Oscillospiraceae bacterium]|nr:hypothetical protein [Oscillospiraceae bacterium]